MSGVPPVSPWLALVVHGDLAALWSPQEQWCGPLAAAVARVADLEATSGPRWVWWSAGSAAPPLVTSGVHLSRVWDVAEVHRLGQGGWRATPDLAWAAASGLDPATIPSPPSGDLFEFAGPAGGDPEDVLDPTGHLRADGVTGAWLTTAERLTHWAHAAYDTAMAQLGGLDDRTTPTAHSESAAALLCVELARDGLPIDRPAMERLIAESAGPRPLTEADARATRASRDAVVLDLVPDAPRTDLRNPAAVRELLLSVGIDVPNTRKWVLEAYGSVHPVVAALLAWRADERIATTYGYGWLDAHVGPDDRLRGGWTACDGAAGRMTAQNGLHNLPASLRSAVAATEGHVFVRADLGQIEPRVLAAVSGDAAFAAASRAEDLYAPVAAELGVERPVAKVAVLAAMYGQRSGAAGKALKGLERAHPVAMGYLDRAYAAGGRGEPVRTFGGRFIRTDFGATAVGVDPGLDAARGRFARNAVIQGAAAELFKAWAATVRATTHHLGAAIVLCLHDELLVHTPVEHSEEVVGLVGSALTDAARRWTGSLEVRFVADTSVLARWSDAKG